MTLTWSSEGEKTNPTADTILADTGAFPATDNLTIYFKGAATVAALMVLEHRDAANDTTLKSQLLPILANSETSPFVLRRYPILKGQRWRVRLDAQIIGRAQASIWWE